MIVHRAKTAGFCMGVSLALDKLDRAIADKKDGQRIVMLGPIIHNPQVLDEYEAKNVSCLQDVKEVQSNDCLVIRAHGVPKGQLDFLKNAKIDFVDATCPKVKKAQLAINKFTFEGAVLLLFGEIDHPEVQGLVSHANNGYYVFDSVDSFDKLSLVKEEKYVLASQTTQDKNNFKQIEKKLLNAGLDVIILHTICDATEKRQKEAMHLADRVQAMIVVGGYSSGNTRRLADIVSRKGIQTFHVEQGAELDLKLLKKYTDIGLTAGASTPKKIIDDIFYLLENVKR